MNHKNCNILGRYDWTCKQKASVGIPGWPKGHKGEFTRYNVWASNIYGGVCEAVVWANGDIEAPTETRPCSLCEKHCKYPVDRFVTQKRDNYSTMF